MIRVDKITWTIFYLPVVLYVMICLLFLATIEIELENEGRYDPVLYRDWRTRDTAKDASESVKKNPHKANPYGNLIERLPMPRYLCYVADNEDGNGLARATAKDCTDEYVFVAYTREQFNTQDSQEDRLKLLGIGVRCAKKANVKAFWVDCYPVDEDYAEKEDIYRICDIVRSAHSLVIAIDSSRYTSQVSSTTSVDSCKTQPNASTRALKVWGNRAWTLPEVLLCSSQHKITVFDLVSLQGIEHSKHGLGHLAWDDWKEAAILVDHYEGSVHLSPLELISIGYRCLRRRRVRGSDNDGRHNDEPREYAYALMGLLRRRPTTVATDSEFMAFARLSLSNNNDSILERVLCMQPLEQGTRWHEMIDAWGAQLWDIEPSCQIAAIDGISEPPFDEEISTQTVVLDGVHGASICWSELAPVPFVKRATSIRRLTSMTLPGIPFIFLLGLFYLLTGTYYRIWDGSNVVNDATVAVYSIVTAVSLAILLASPYLLKNLFYGKFWSTQARFYGIEGYHDIKKLEEQLFGTVNGRLRWSTSTSLQSDVALAKDGLNFEGKDPHVPEKLPERHEDGDCRCLFTLVDTYVLEVTAFYAERPPTVVMILGRERGMQRAVLCSYDWRTQAFCREVVLRMKTVVLNRMSRVDKFRFMLQKPGRLGQTWRK